MKPLGQFDMYLIHEFVEDYKDGFMSRRDMIRRVLLITGGVATTATLLTQMGVTPMTRVALAQETASTPGAVPQSPLHVPEDDPQVIAEEITFPAEDGATISAYQARRSTEGSPVAAVLPPLVLICHENRGLTDHIRDVARRWALQGYVACAIDLLSREGGTASIGDSAEIPSLIMGGDLNRHVSDFQAALAHYQEMPELVDATRVAMTGFCIGGGITWLAATQMPELKAAAPYYGPPPPLEDVPNISAAMLGIYSDDPDDGANEGREALEQALIDAGVTFQFIIYPDTQHAFHNDTGQRYNEEQALAAWNDTVAWFAEYV